MCNRTGWDARRASIIGESTTEVAAAARCVMLGGRAGEREAIVICPLERHGRREQEGEEASQPRWRRQQPQARRHSDGWATYHEDVPPSSSAVNAFTSRRFRRPDLTAWLLSVDVTCADRLRVYALGSCHRFLRVRCAASACVSCGWDGMPSSRRSQFTAPSSTPCSEHVSCTSIDRELLMVATTSRTAKNMRVEFASLALERLGAPFLDNKAGPTRNERAHKPPTGCTMRLSSQLEEKSARLPSQPTPAALQLLWSSCQEMSRFDSVTASVGTNRRTLMIGVAAECGVRRSASQRIRAEAAGQSQAKSRRGTRSLSLSSNDRASCHQLGSC